MTDAILHELRERKSAPGEGDIRALHAEHLARYGGDVRAARQATRVEVHGILQIVEPVPGADDVTDEDRVNSDKYRAADPYHTDALHWRQKMHQKRLWEETDALLDAALRRET